MFTVATSSQHQTSDWQNEEPNDRETKNRPGFQLKKKRRKKCTMTR